MVWSTVLPVATLLVNATGGDTTTYNDLIETTVTIVRNCSNANQRFAVLLAGHYDEFLGRSLFDDLPLALISDSGPNGFEFYTKTRYSFTEFKKFSALRLLRKLHQFVVVAPSQPLLQLLLQRIKDSTWNNFNGFYFLIDRDTEVRGCSNAYKFLWTAWKYDLLSTLFLCLDPAEGLLIYTYNPYSNVVPSSWLKVDQFKGRNGHPWLLLRRKYRAGPRMCEHLHFDKTTDLAGYEVRLNAISFLPHLPIEPHRGGLNQFMGDNGEIVKLVFRQLNATMKVIVNNGSVYELGGIEEHGHPSGMLEEVATGKVDMCMNARNLYTTWKVENTYPHDQDGICAITLRASEVSEFTRIVHFMSLPVMLGTVTILLITLCTLAKHEGFLPAVLDVIRLMIAVSIRRMPRSVAGRIFFSNVFILMIIMNSLMQSHLASLLTLPAAGTNIETAEDLKKSNYLVYGATYLAQQIQDPVLRSRFRPTTYEGCKQQVNDHPHSACLGDCIHLYVRISNDNRKFFRTRKLQTNLQVYVTRENWSLLRPVSKVIQNAVEAGLVVMWKKVAKAQLHRAWKTKMAQLFRNYRTLRMKHVAFTFYLLVTGYAAAAIVFVFELLVARYKPRIVEMFNGSSRHRTATVRVDPFNTLRTSDETSRI